ncbi:MAG TPA: DUF1343 domain-containing protein [Chloroflexaceae bacterium]|nr:DUF1343 domain-containing protein [Chloroflexaceae bacterium]
MTTLSATTGAVRPGICALIEGRADLLRGPIGVLTGPSGVLPDLTPSAAALARAADVRAYFAPEHGLLGASPEAAGVADGTFAGAPVYSLYGARMAPAPAQLAGLAAVVCDYQDIGCRYYTYAWTLVKLMEAAAPLGVRVVVCDRPNPLGGQAVEGPGLDPAHASLVGLHDVPTRHGLTLGELAALANAERGLGCDLAVVPCEGWRREQRWDATGLPWAPPSPNMPTHQANLVYPGTCLAEGANLSVGRGTAMPFEWVGAPWVDGPALAAALNRLGLPGVRWRAVAFQPALAPYAGEVCYGVQPHVTDAAALRSVLAGVALLAALRDLHGAAFQISPADAIYADPAQMAARGYGADAMGAAHFDRLAGGPGLREALEAGAAPETIASGWAAGEAAFRERRARHLRYD